MAELLTKTSDWWPVDKIVLAYFAAATLLELIYWSRLPDPWMLLVVHLAGALLIWLMACYPRNRFLNFFHYWYPLPYVFFCYKEMGILIPAVRTTNADAWLAEVDLAIWGAHPTVWLERFRSPLLVEALVVVYSGFVPAVLIVAFLLWKKRQFQTFR